MINLGLNQAQWNEYQTLLTSSHQIIIDVAILDQNHRYIKNISDRLIDGSVDLDSSADITRSAKLTLADPLGDLGLSPSDVQNQYRWLIQIHYGVAPLPGDSQFTPRVWWAPIFTGPLTDMERNGVVLEVQCQGKEVMMSSPGAGLTLPKGYSKMAMMVLYALGQGELLGNIMVEMTTATGPAGVYQPTSTTWSWEPGTNMWREFKGLLEAQGVQPFYDGYGRLRVRVPPGQAIWQFNNYWLTEKVNPVLDMDAFRNTWQVVGGTPAGYTGRVRAEATLPWYHPLSPVMLTRDGKQPRYLRGVTQDDNIVDINEAIFLANRNLSEAVMLSYDVQMTMLIAPFLEEYDMGWISTPEYSGGCRVMQMSIPLVGDMEMSVGFLSTSSKFTARGSKVKVIQNLKKKPKKKKKRKKNKGRKKKPHFEAGAVK